MSDKQWNFGRMTANETELILDAQRGDMNAFEEIVQKYDKQVLTIVAGYVNSSDDAKDIYQEVFLRVYKGLPKFQHRSEFSTWLFRITTNACLSYKSRKQNYRHTSLDQSVNNDEGGLQSMHETLAGENATDRQAHDTEISERVEQALLKLSPRQRMVFTLKHYEGYKLREIAEMMKCGEGTVKKYLFEAIAKLRVQLKDIAS